MSKYYVLKADRYNGKGRELLETLEAGSLTEARKEATSKYLDVVTGMKEQLIVVSESGYNAHHRAYIERNHREAQFQDSIRRNLSERQQNGETNDMLGLRLSGMIQGLLMANAISQTGATRIIIAMKNEFNF